jgi:hypothetical protein
MPVLRQEPDTSLGDTLGNLGASLTQAFNPLNQIRAQTMTQELAKSRFELQQEANIDAARRNAADVYERANPDQVNPAELATRSAAIRSGNYNPEQYVNAFKTAGTFKQAQAAAAAVDGDMEMGKWPDADKAAAKTQLLGGASLGDIRRAHAEGTLATAKTSSALAAGDAAGAAAQSDVFPANSALAKAAAIAGQEADAAKLTSQAGAAKSAIFDPNAPDAAANLDKFRLQQAAGGLGTAAPVAVEPGLIAQEVAKQSAIAKTQAVEPTKVFPDIKTTIPPTVAGAPSATVSIPGQGSDTTTIAANEAARVGSEASTKARFEDVNADIGTGRKSNDMLRTVALMREYGNKIKNNTLTAQALLAFTDRARELGLTLTPNESALTVFQALSNSLIASIRGEDGILRVAGPELGFFTKTLPNPFSDTAALTANLDSLEGKARRLISVGNEARRTLGRSRSGVIGDDDYNKYLETRDKLLQPPTLNEPPNTPDTSGPGAPRPPVQTNSNRTIITMPDGTVLH